MRRFIPIILLLIVIASGCLNNNQSQTTTATYSAPSSLVITTNSSGSPTITTTTSELKAITVTIGTNETIETNDSVLTIVVTPDDAFATSILYNAYSIMNAGLYREMTVTIPTDITGWYYMRLNFRYSYTNYTTWTYEPMETFMTNHAGNSLDFALYYAMMAWKAGKVPTIVLMPYSGTTDYLVLIGNTAFLPNVPGVMKDVVMDYYYEAYGPIDATFIELPLNGMYRIWHSKITYTPNPLVPNGDFTFTEMDVFKNSTTSVTFVETLILNGKEYYMISPPTITKSVPITRNFIIDVNPATILIPAQFIMLPLYETNGTYVDPYYEPQAPVAPGFATLHIDGDVTYITYTEFDKSITGIMVVKGTTQES